MTVKESHNILVAQESDKMIEEDKIIKETKKIADALDLIKNHTIKDGDKTLTGFNTPLGQSFHNAILDELFKTSTVKLKNKSLIS